MTYPLFELDAPSTPGEETVALRSKRREIIFHGKVQLLSLNGTKILYQDIDEISLILIPKNGDDLLRMALCIEHRTSGKLQREKILLRLSGYKGADQCLQLMEKIAKTGVSIPVSQDAFRSSQQKEIHWSFYRKEIRQHTLQLAIFRQAREGGMTLQEISADEEKEVLSEHALLQIPQVPSLPLKLLDVLPIQAMLLIGVALLGLFVNYPAIVMSAISGVFILYSWAYERQVSSTANARLVLNLIPVVALLFIVQREAASFWLSGVWFFNALFLLAWLWVRRERHRIAPLWFSWQLGTVSTIIGWVIFTYSTAAQLIPTLRRQLTIERLQDDQPLWPLLKDKELGEKIFQSVELLRSAAKWCDGYSEFDTRECAFVYSGLRQHMFSEERIIYAWRDDTGVRLFIGALMYELSTPTPEDDLRENLPWIVDRLPPKQNPGFRLGMMNKPDATRQIYMILQGSPRFPAQTEALLTLLEQIGP